MSAIQFQVSHAGWVAAALLLGLAGAFLAWRSRRAWPERSWAGWAAPLLKLTGFALLVAMLLNPLVTGREFRKGANDFVILVDHGQSMALHAGEEVVGELKSAGGQPDSWLARLEQEFRVERHLFDQRLRSWPETGEPRFEGCRSDLVHALEQVKERFARRPLAGVLVFSDGLLTDAERIDALELGFPVFPVVCQSEKPLADVGIQGAAVATSDFEDAPVTMTVNLRSENLRGENILTVVRDATGAEVARDEHLVRGDREEHAFQARFRPAKPGLAAYRIEALCQGKIAEATPRNNAWVETVDRGRGPYRVLYVCGRPNWEHKFLGRALAPDADIQLVGLVRVAKREPKFVWRGRPGETSNPLFRGFQGQSPEEEPGHDKPVLIRLNTASPEELRTGFPTVAGELFGRYQAVVLDDLEADFFTEDQQRLLERFVATRGGSLLVLGGQESLNFGGYQRTTLGQMLPVYLDGVPDGLAPPADVRLELTREGWLEPWVRLRPTEAEERERLAGQPAFRSFHRLGEVKPGASVLATAVDSSQQRYPALVTQAFGEGRVAALLLGDVWRWGMEDEAQRADMERWWRQLVRWLVADVPRFVQVETAWSDEGLALRLVQVRVRRPDFQLEENAAVELMVTGMGNDSVEPTRLIAEPSLEEPGLYTAKVPVAYPGAYRVEARVSGEGGELLGEGEAGWSWNPSGAEFASLRAKPDHLERIAAKAGGRLLHRGDLEGFLRDLPRMEMPIQETWVRPLWHQPAMFLLVLGCLLGEWALRRWRGRT